MSSSLTWSVVPTEPKLLGGATHPFKGWVLSALGLGSLSDVELIHVRESPHILQKDSRAHAYLQGIQDGLSIDAVDYQTLSDLLRDIERYGQVLIGAE